MENILSMNDLKRTGLSRIKNMFKNEPEIIVQDRGKDAFVLIDIEYYSYLRELELEMAVIQARKEITEGKYTTGVKEHIKELEEYLAIDGEK